MPRRRRGAWRGHGWAAPVPVICCGNATAGGAGKTTVALDLGMRLADRGIAAHFLLRGYGGSLKGPLRVDPDAHDSTQVGDEALLLAAMRPTWISADRGAGARPRWRPGAQAIVMDDGLQNPTLEKDLSLLVIDGNFGFGNGRVIPAGPLREPVARRRRPLPGRGADRQGRDRRRWRSCRPACRCCAPAWWPGRRRRCSPASRSMPSAASPTRAKFFATLQEAGAVLAGRDGLRRPLPL